VVIWARETSGSSWRAHDIRRRESVACVELMPFSSGLTRKRGASVSTISISLC
jgi:hypothetical protein